MSQSLHIPSMRTVLRLLLMCVLLGCLGFCAFGFLATFEPMSVRDRTVWRTVYALAGTGFILGLARLVRCQLLIWLKRHPPRP
jgi:hypothetical protein